MVFSVIPVLKSDFFYHIGLWNAPIKAQTTEHDRRDRKDEEKAHFVTLVVRF
jgi:hypothetical protein